MPGSDGITVAKKLREMNHGGEIVFFTGTIDYAVNGYMTMKHSYLIKERLHLRGLAGNKTFPHS